MKHPGHLGFLVGLITGLCPALANGDSLGWPLPHGKLTVEAVKAELERAGLDPYTALPK